MALKERVEQTFLDLGWEPRAVSVMRDHIENGIPSWKVVSCATAHSGKVFEFEWTIAKANGMSEDQMTKVIKSYIKETP